MRDVVKSIDIFYSGPRRRFRPTATSEDFGSSEKLGLMLKLGDSSSSLVIFWSQNNNGRFARCGFPQFLGDLPINRHAHLQQSPFRRFSFADPGDFASLLNRMRNTSEARNHCGLSIYSWPLSFAFMKSFCGTLMFRR